MTARAKNESRTSTGSGRGTVAKGRAGTKTKWSRTSAQTMMGVTWDQFLADVECTREMFVSVMPVLTDIDGKRRAVVNGAVRKLGMLAKRSPKNRAKRLAHIIEHLQILSRNS